MSKIGYIYKYTFPNGKVYIGQTAQTMEARHYQHMYNADHLDAERSILLVDRAIHKYGEPKLEIVETIMYEDNDPIGFQEELNEKEKLYIRKYKSTQKRFGYNRHLGGKEITEKLILEDKWYELFEEQNWSESIANVQGILYEYIKQKVLVTHETLEKDERYVWNEYKFMDYDYNKETTFCEFYYKHKNDPWIYDIGDFDYKYNGELDEPEDKEGYIFDRTIRIAVEDHWIEDIRQTIWKQIMDNKGRIIDEYNTESTFLD